MHEIEPLGTYRPQYRLRFRSVVRWLDPFPQTKEWLASLVRRSLRHIFEPSMVTTERVVEYPFVFENLKQIRGPVLDVGCCHSRLPIALASRGYHVVGLDFQSYLFRHPSLQAIRGDLTALPFTRSSFDAVVAVSVIEHIGIGHYGDPETATGDRQAVRQLAQVLKRGGRLILTVPFGVSLTNDWMRVYDSRRLADLCEPLRTDTIEFAVGRSGIWRPGSRAEAQTIDWAGPDRAIAMIVATAT